jgi:hypothetical protein
MKHFKYFPTFQIDINNDGIKRDYPDIFRTVRLITLDDIASYSYYTIHDGERPDHVSMKLYGTSDYYWTLFLANNMKNAFFDWALSQSEFETWIKRQYPNTVFTYDEDASLKLVPNEIVVGSLSGAKAKLVSKDSTLKQIMVCETQGEFITNEGIQGETSNDTINILTSTPEYFSASETDPSLSIYDQQFQINEDKKKIRYVEPRYIEDVVLRYREAVNG